MFYFSEFQFNLNKQYSQIVDLFQEKEKNDFFEWTFAIKLKMHLFIGAFSGKVVLVHAVVTGHASIQEDYISDRKDYTFLKLRF